VSGDGVDDGEDRPGARAAPLLSLDIPAILPARAAVFGGLGVFAIFAREPASREGRPGQRADFLLGADGKQLPFRAPHQEAVFQLEGGGAVETPEARDRRHLGDRRWGKVREAEMEILPCRFRSSIVSKISPGRSRVIAMQL